MSFVHRCVFTFGVLSGLVSAAPAATETDRLILPPTPTEAPEVASTACGDLIVAKEQGMLSTASISESNHLKPNRTNSVLGLRCV